MKAKGAPAVDEVLTADEAAAFLKVRKRELARLGVPALVLSHKIRRYSRADILSWLYGKRTR